MALKLSSPLSATFIPFLVEAGFSETANFTKAGILYIENQDLTASGSFNTFIFQVRCKKADCGTSIKVLEDVLAKMG